MRKVCFHFHFLHLFSSTLYDEFKTIKQEIYPPVLAGFAQKALYVPHDQIKDSCVIKSECIEQHISKHEASGTIRFTTQRKT